MPQNQVQSTICFLKCPVPSQENGYCYIIVRFCVGYILMLCFCCVVVLLYLIHLPQFQFVPGFGFPYRLMNFEQRCTTVAFISPNLFHICLFYKRRKLLRVKRINKFDSRTIQGHRNCQSAIICFNTLYKSFCDRTGAIFQI